MSEGGLLVDLNELRRDYYNGHSAMGHPANGYYITTWRGMESLQTFATNEAISGWSGDTTEFNVREVSVTDDGTEYEMRGWTERNFMDRINTSIDFNLGEEFTSSQSHWDKNDGTVYESVIDNVYGGHMDRRAVLSAATNYDRDIMHERVLESMKYDILRAKRGDTDDRAKAGAHAYQNVLARDARLVNFGARDVTEFDTHTGQDSVQLTEDQWMERAGQAYVGYILDTYDNPTPDVVLKEDVKPLMDSMLYTNHAQMLQEDFGWDKWDTMESFLKKDVMFFIDSKDDVRFDLGLDYLNKVHDAVGVSPHDDLYADNFDPYTYNLNTNRIENDDDNRYDDEWDLEL